MADAASHPTDLVQDAVAGRLDEAQRAVLDAHLATCERCRRELAALRWTRVQLASSVEAPPDIVEDLRAALDAEDDRARDGGRPAPPRVGLRSAVLLGIGTAAALVAIVWVANRSAAATAPVEAAAIFRAISSGATTFEVRTADPVALESRFRNARLPFAARVFDFAMMRYALVGGGLQQFQGRDSALFAYRSDDGRLLVCQMYVGDIDELPAPTERRRQNDIEFLVYRSGELTIVFWDEGDVLCVLVADGDAEAAIRLAFAKAIKR
jgi:anti-sigma factor RsiW